ncbi:probable bifunctional TENA-E protein [Henckelia pumila]|uniref:probable bifunctional TENA-E protein n=1 Tax=Henckelia pumila TaxID=405737 RepID=UPI003C6E6733
MEGLDRAAVVDTWVKKYRRKYLRAIRHPFILGIRDGSVEMSSFRRWLAQDYLFVRAFVPFVASVLVKAWKESDDNFDVDVILAGIAALNEEIAWFKKEAMKWNVILDDVEAEKINLDYCNFLESLMSSEVSYTQSVTIFWAIEVVYQESFAHCLEDGSKTPDELKDTCHRWGSEGFGHYCQDLKNIANRRLEKVSDDVLVKTEASLLCVLEHEVEFWNMSRGAN